jgi:hypothetical protein
VKVKITYNAEVKYHRYRVYAKNHILSFWSLVDTFDDLQEAKNFAKNLFDNEIPVSVYKSSADIK